MTLNSGGVGQELEEASAKEPRIDPGNIVVLEKDGCPKAKRVPCLLF